MTDDSKAYEGKWDFSGSCAPSENGSAVWAGQQTFSLGCFQWVKRKSGKGFRPGKVRYRIKGHVSEPQIAYAKAREFCDKKNASEATE